MKLYNYQVLTTSIYNHMGVYTKYNEK